MNREVLFCPCQGKVQLTLIFIFARIKMVMQQKDIIKLFTFRFMNGRNKNGFTIGAYKILEL